MREKYARTLAPRTILGDLSAHHLNPYLPTHARTPPDALTHHMLLAEGAPGRGWGGANIHALPRHMDAAPLESEPGQFTACSRRSI